MQKPVLLALAMAVACHLGDVTVGAQTTGATMPFFKNYFVTGDYSTVGVGLRGRGVDGIASGSMKITDVPAGADIAAAFLAGRW
ncbi:MAG: hypothetical protein R2712_28600 [Vicinamibacterales bacterium]